MGFFLIEDTKVLNGSGVLTAVWNFFEGNLSLGVIVTISIIIINILKAYKTIQEIKKIKNNKDKDVDI